MPTRRSGARSTIPQQAQATIGALGDDEYGQTIKQGMERITERLH